MSPTVASFLSIILGLVLLLPSTYAFIRDLIFYRKNNWNFDEAPDKWKINPSPDEHVHNIESAKVKGVGRFVTYIVLFIVGFVFLSEGLFGL